MVTDSAALVLFAMRSAVKLGLQARKAYIDATKRRELVLPLPKFFADVTWNDQAQWFDSGDGQPYQERAPRLKELIKKFAGTNEEFTQAEKDELNEFYKEFHTLDLAEKGLLPPGPDGDFPAEDAIAWVTVRQWCKGSDPNPSTLQRLAGTFIEIGVDYFANMPGALQPGSGWGRALHGFLNAMDEVRFAEGKLSDLPGRLFVAALETLSEHSALISGDPKVQEIIKVTAKSLSLDVSDRLKAIDEGDIRGQNRVKDWADLVFRSVLSSAGRLVVSDPERFLGVDDKGRGLLVTNVGNAVLSVILDDPTRRLDKMFGRVGLERVIQAALATVGEHPEILLKTNNQGLTTLLGEITTQLSQFDALLTPDMLPELIRLILEKSGQHLELVFPNLATSPEKNLLLAAAKTTLGILSQPVPGAAWQPRFARADLLRVTETVLDQLVANPAWLLAKASAASADLEAALRAMLKVLAARADQRLGPATAAEILQEALKAVALRQEFLNQLPAGAGVEARPVIAAALDAVVASIFKPGLDAKAAWQLVRAEAMNGVVQIALRQLSRSRLTLAAIMALQTSMKQFTDALANGAPLLLETWEADLQQALANV